MRDDVPSFEFDDDDTTTGRPGMAASDGGMPSDIIDLNSIFNKELTTSGSFNAVGIKYKSLCKLLHAVPIPALLVDKGHTIAFQNNACERITSEELTGRKFSSIFAFESRSREVAATLDDIFLERKAKVSEEELSIDGKSLWGRIYLRPIRLAKARSILVIIEDLTLERRQIQLLDKITRAKQEWEQTFDTVQDMIAIVDSDLGILRLNKAMARRTGIKIEDVIGRHCYEVIHETSSPPDFCPYLKAMHDGQEHSTEYFEPNMGAYIVESIFPNVSPNKGPISCVIVARDITEQKRLDEELKRHANYDSLTNILNRRRVMELLDSAFESTKRYNLPLSLAICDIDNFKEINDVFGHQSGDLVLTKFGEVIRHELRKADFAGRYGGDEFIIIYPHTPAAGAAECMERIISRIGAISFYAGSTPFTVTCSAGIAEFDSGMLKSDNLIHWADMALYEAKQQGRNRVVLSKPTIYACLTSAQKKN